MCYRLAITLSDHKRRLSALSRTDSLTGLLNHGEDWLDAADKALYTAKRDGRNRVNAAPGDATAPGSALHIR